MLCAVKPGSRVLFIREVFLNIITLENNIGRYNDVTVDIWVGIHPENFVRFFFSFLSGSDLFLRKTEYLICLVR